MKRVERDGEGLDRLSALPDSLIEEILSFLEMRDVVGTSLLSHRWKNLWTTTPCLDFDESGQNLVQTRNFINRVLLCWEGAYIRRFKINLSSPDEFDHASLSGDMDLWVRFATKKKVKELYVNLPFDYGRKPLESSSNISVYLPPQSCSSITKLCLVGCNLEINGNVNVNVRWDQLKSLKIDGYCDMINQVVSSAPQLEMLYARLFGRHQNLSIQSSSLKKLTLNVKYLPSRIHDPSNYTELTIRAPNLEALAISGAAYTKCLLMDVSSLTDATLDFDDLCRLAVIEETLSQILPGIQHVESLTISLRCFKRLKMIEPKYSFSVVFRNVKILELIGGPINAYDIVRVGKIFPKVEKLVIDWKLDSPYSKYVANLNEPDINVDDGPKKKLVRLRTVEITWYEATTFPVIKFLVKYATKKLKIVIRKGR